MTIKINLPFVLKISCTAYMHAEWYTTYQTNDELLKCLASSDVKYCNDVQQHLEYAVKIKKIN